MKTEARGIHKDDWIKFGGLLLRVERVENIGSVGTPFMRLHFPNGFLNINGTATVKVRRRP